MIDSPKYDKIRLGITSTSASNGCMLEIYRNLTDDYYTIAVFSIPDTLAPELPKVNTAAS